MDNIDMTNILKTLSSFEEKKNEEPEIKLTLTESIENVIKESSLADKVILIANEVVSFTNCVKQLTVEGRIQKERESEVNTLQVKLHEKLVQLIGHNVNFDEFWKVKCGTMIGDKFDGFECIDVNNEKVIIKPIEGKSLIIDIWKSDAELANYLEIKAHTMSELTAGNVEGINLEKLEFMAISADNFYQWKSIVNNTNIDKYLKQYVKTDIIENLSIEPSTMLPALLVIDNEGVIKFLDNYANIDFEESLKKLSNGTNIIKLRDEGEVTNMNAWWLDMDSHTKIDIVRDINMSIRQLGVNNAGFAIITKYIFKEGKMTSSTFPTFMGTVFETEYEILQSYAIELQNSWNLTNFQFNCKIISFE
jgi:hypothetical protein